MSPEYDQCSMLPYFGHFRLFSKSARIGMNYEPNQVETFAES